MCDMGRHGEHVNELIPNNIQSEIFADVGRLMNNQTSGSGSFSFLFFLRAQTNALGIHYILAG